VTVREKVIKGFELCLTPNDRREYDDADVCHTECPYFRAYNMGDCIRALAKDALTLLKAQEPRVMTLEEVKQHNNQDGCVWFEQPTYNADAAFVLKEDFMIQVISPYILGEPINHGYWTNGNYGKTWRCWTSRPTDEQREAVKWE
jgi:hypothetical protein